MRESSVMDGVYNEMTRSRAFSVEPPVCTPAAWNGIELARPEPIHQIPGRPIAVSSVTQTPATIGSTHTSHSQAKHSGYFFVLLRAIILRHTAADPLFY